MVRQIFVFIHRWAGLAMTVFLIVVALTGSMLAFKTDLERLICPRIYATPRPGVPTLDFATLAERGETLVPHGRAVSVFLAALDQAVVWFESRKDPATGKPYDLGFNELFLDPWTGEELGRRNNGDLSQGLINLIPFVYNLHLDLTLGAKGRWFLGVIALIWTLDCFVGFYLTLPRTLSGFWRRWKPAWLIKWERGFFRLNFDLHRASGLWLWPMLFIFAWSSVMLSLPSVYEWVSRSLFDYAQPVEASMATTPRPDDQLPKLDWRAAEAVGERLIAEEAYRDGFSAGRPVEFYFNPDDGTYSYSVRSSPDIEMAAGPAVVIFDGDNGTLRRLFLPTSAHSGETVSTWLRALHMADLHGSLDYPYRIFVCMLGLVIVVLSATGVYIWWKKRRARISSNSASALGARLRQTANASAKGA